MQNELIIRDALPADLPFIYDSWLNHYQANSYFAKRIPKHIFMKCHALLLNQLIDRPTVTIKIAGDKDFTIFGYVVAEHTDYDPVIHYIYVRPEFQKLTIGTQLISALELKKPFQASHWVPLINELEKKFTKLIYNPYVL